MQKIDSNNQVMWCNYDHDNKLVYLTNKGSSFMNYFYLNEAAATPELIPLDKFSRKETIIQTFFLPKSTVDCNKCEINRAI